ncbi:MAG: glycosyltransferase family 4 protein [Bryobacterales bacterium]|nr:glycosyltransferase family 4 protein [Bryobacterales bacterium]
MQVLYIAAHAVDAGESYPLGGGAAIAKRLREEWSGTAPFDVRVIGPSILGGLAPTGEDIVRFSEPEYARFCGAFERAASEEILRHNPAETVVLANDIAEGPDFVRLRRAGFRLATIFHVDVVAYISSIYLRNWVRPETTVRWFQSLRLLPMPAIARLIWQKQRDCVEQSELLIVPSQAMQTTLERCYPRHACGKTVVLPWGSVPAMQASEGEVAALRREFGIGEGAKVLLTLSRISPEKGQHVLLESLREWERSATPPPDGVVLLVCGEAAYMQGRAYRRKLRELAGKLSRIRVHFAGHVTGARKAACFALADLYLFPSIHESYGLTLMEALGAGLPAICLPSDGSQEVMRPGLGAVVGREQLWSEIRQWLENDGQRRAAGESARAYAGEQRFDRTAQRLAALLAGIGLR